MAVNFNTKQQKAVCLIDDFLKDLPMRYFYLFGYAGSGKTFVTTKIIKNLVSEKKIDHVFICASTHQALNVISSHFRATLTVQEEIEFFKTINCMTLQKLLEYKPVIDNESGKKIFKASTESKFLKKVESKLIIIDECSMISKGMIEDIKKYVELYHIKVIFLGDEAQLPPVDEPISIVFSSVPVTVPPYPYHIVLDEIMRTKKASIKDVCTIIRSWNKKDQLAQMLLPIHNQKAEFKLYHQKKDITEATWFKNFLKKAEYWSFSDHLDMD